MPAIADKLGRASLPTDVAVATTVKTTRAPGVLVIEAIDLSKYAIDTPVFFVTYKKTTDPLTGVVSISSLVSYKALVNTGANTLTNLTVAPGYTDLGNAVGDFIECIPTSYWENSLIDALQKSHNPDGSIIIGQGEATGVVKQYAGSVAPSSYLMCDGTSYLRADYPALFTVIGTTYGAVDGTHFNVPDARDRTIIGVGAATAAFNFASTDVNTTTNVITVPANESLWTGQKVRFTTTTTLPGGLSAGVDYYVVRLTSTTIKLATSLALATLDGGTSLVDLTSQGSGTHTATITYTTRALGAIGGEETHALTDPEMPKTRIRSEGGDFWNQDLGGGVGGWAFNPGGANNGQKKLRVDAGGGYQSHNIMQPWLALNYIIKT